MCIENVVKLHISCNGNQFITLGEINKYMIIK